jgi:hypothetical protein
MSGYINSQTKQVGRHDLAPGFGNLDTLAKQEAGILGGPKEYGKARESAWGSASLYAHGNDKAKNIENAIGHYSPQLSNTDRDEREKAAVFFHELKAMQPNASGEVRDRIQVALDTNRTAINRVEDPTDPFYINNSPLGVSDVETGKQSVQEFDPTIGPSGGYVNKVTPATGLRTENATERIDRKARTYERPDPNKL